MRRRRTQPFLCKLCASWFDESDAGVSRGELADGTRFILCGGCTLKFDGSSGAGREQLRGRIRETVSELDLV